MEQNTEKIPKVVILCGGIGTRLKEETEYKPKPLVEIGGLPILYHIMKIYSHYCFKDFILCLGYKGNMIRDYLLKHEYYTKDFTFNLKNKNIEIHNKEEENDLSITFVDTGSETNTGGRIKRIEKYINTENFLATYGDGVADINIKNLYQYHLNHGRIATLTGLRPTSKYGIVEINNKDIITTFKEKPQMKEWISGGFFVFNRKIFDYLDENCVLEREPFQRLAQEGQFGVFRHNGFWGCMDTYKDAMWLNELWVNNEAKWKIWK